MPKSTLELVHSRHGRASGELAPTQPQPPSRPEPSPSPPPVDCLYAVLEWQSSTAEEPPVLDSALAGLGSTPVRSSSARPRRQLRLRPRQPRGRPCPPSSAVEVDDPAPSVPDLAPCRMFEPGELMPSPSSAGRLPMPRVRNNSAAMPSRRARCGALPRARRGSPSPMPASSRVLPRVSRKGKLQGKRIFPPYAFTLGKRTLVKGTIQPSSSAACSYRPHAWWVAKRRRGKLQTERQIAILRPSITFEP